MTQRRKATLLRAITTGDKSVVVPVVVVVPEADKDKKKKKKKSSGGSGSTHLCVNCGAHTEGWPAEWKRYDPLLHAIWCRVCYSPQLATLHTLVKNYNISRDLLETLPCVYAYARASPDMRCFLVAQVFEKLPREQRVSAPVLASAGISQKYGKKNDNAAAAAAASLPPAKLIKHEKTPEEEEQEQDRLAAQKLAL
jgi:hypothetical protein